MNRCDADQELVFAMTADAFADDIVLAKQVGMNAHFAKPLDMNVILKEITRLIAENEVEKNETL